MFNGGFHLDYGLGATVNASGVLLSHTFTDPLPKRFILEISCSSTLGAKIAIDGVVVASHSLPVQGLTVLGGGVPGGIGQVYSSVRATLGGWSGATGDGLFTGKILNAIMYRNVYV